MGYKKLESMAGKQLKKYNKNKKMTLIRHLDINIYIYYYSFSFSEHLLFQIPLLAWFI